MELGNCIPAERRKIRKLTSEGIFHIGILSPAVKKKKENPFLPQQQCTNHRLLPKSTTTSNSFFSEIMFKNHPPQCRPKT